MKAMIELSVPGGQYTEDPLCDYAREAYVPDTGDLIGVQDRCEEDFIKVASLICHLPGEDSFRQSGTDSLLTLATPKIEYRAPKHGNISIWLTMTLEIPPLGQIAIDFDEAVIALMACTPNTPSKRIMALTSKGAYKNSFGKSVPIGHGGLNVFLGVCSNIHGVAFPRDKKLEEEKRLDLEARVSRLEAQ